MCVLLLALFAVLSASAIAGKGHTYDEPLHGLGAWINLRCGDYRVAYELPPLWKYWLALPVGRDAIRADFDSPDWRQMPSDPDRRWAWAVQTLYRTPGNDADRFIRRERMMMLVVGVALGATIAGFAWQLAGPVAAVVATALYALDPNFLGHAPIVKNDVAMSLVLLAQTWLLWRGGRRLSAWHVVGLGLVWGAALTIKYSAAAYVVAAVLTLLMRAAAPAMWPTGRGPLRKSSSRLAAVLVVTAAGAVIAYAMIWGAYRFRYAPTPDPAVRISFQPDLSSIRVNQVALAHPDGFGPKELTAWRPDATVRAILFSDRHHLFPQAWLAGLLYTRLLSLGQDAFLLGQIGHDGWWYYFPVAALVKTPLATLAAVAGAGWVLLAGRKRGRAEATAAPDPSAPPRWWTAASIAIPIAVYGTAALSSKIDMGVRYVFPLYPLVFVIVGIAAARARGWRPRGTMLVLGALAAALAAESLAAYPNYIAFFNAAAGGPRGGLALLGDSNLDWGQDLPLLARWQQAHPDVKLYLCYFGWQDPASLGIRYANLPGGYVVGPPGRWPRDPGVVAISATHLQGTLMPEDLRRTYAEFARQKPIEVLGGTIYLYAYRPGVR